MFRGQGLSKQVCIGGGGLFSEGLLVKINKRPTEPFRSPQNWPICQFWGGLRQP